MNNKHLMTLPKGNSEFWYPEKFNVPRGEAECNIEVKGKQNLLLPVGPVIKCFVVHPNSNWNNIHRCQLTTLLQNVTNFNGLQIINVNHITNGKTSLKSRPISQIHLNYNGNS